MLKIVGLGTGCPDGITAAAQQAIVAAEAVFVQTDRLPQIAALHSKGIEYTSMDDLYQGAENYEQLNDAIAARLLESAASKYTVYCVFGSGMEGQQAAQLAMEGARRLGLGAGLEPGLSAIAHAAALAGQAQGYCAHFGELDMLRMDTDTAHVLCDIDRQLKAAEAKIQLMDLYPEQLEISIVYFDSARPEVTKIQLEQLDRLANYTPYSYVVLPPVGLQQRARYGAADLSEICHILRSPGGCPWDREQSHFSLKRNMLEEAQEAVAAIDEGDMYHLCEELGDVLLQVALHSEIAREHGEFGILDVTSGICEKMIRRHPHVFADVAVAGTEEVLSNWEMIKAAEPGHGSKGFGSGSVGLPGLMRANELQKEAAKAGFDWDRPEPAMEKLFEEVDELKEALSQSVQRTEAEAGDLLFAAVNIARLAGVDSETALIGCCDRFARRFRAMEAYAEEKGAKISDFDLTEQNSLWERAKSEE